MRLVTGPAGSGKTTVVLNSLREALRNRDHRVRLLVPTATLAHHLQNQIAREGFVFHRSLIQTLSGFVDEWAGGDPQVPDAVVRLIVEAVVHRLNLAEFRRVMDTAGFHSSLATTLAEFSSAGCHSARLAKSLPGSPLAAAFLEVYQEVERELTARRVSLRAQRLARAAERIRREGTGGIRQFWLDGFHALPDPELDVIGALSRHAHLTLTLSDSDLTEDARARLAAMGFRQEARQRSRPEPAMAVVRAASIEREVEEIARRILEQADAGRPLREIGIIVRAADTYVPILRAALERFGIPARFYFDSPMDRHAAIRFLAGAVDAMLGGWEHAATLAVLRLAPRFANSEAMDRFDFAVREQLPNSGLGPLRLLAAGSDALAHKIDALGTLEEWRSFQMSAVNWAARFRTLRNLFRPARLEDRPPQGVVEAARSQAAALDLFDQALDEAALALGSDCELPFETFWRALKSVLRLKPLRVEDGRRDVVHVLSAHEARQWVLPVVFVCGLVEKQFPQARRQDPFFPEAARAALNAAGIRVRTAAEFEREERALFDSAVTRATLLVTLSYPQFDARGERNLRSAYLEDCLVDEEDARPVRPRPGDVRAAANLSAGIQAPVLLNLLREKTARLSPTSLETYLRCPFMYFGGRTLRLQAPPVRPRERMDFLTQGSIVHEVLARWYAQPDSRPQDLPALFAGVFESTVEEHLIPPGYHTERLRNAMLEDLLAFASDGKWPRGRFASRLEESFEFALDDLVRISGKIDRLDVAPDGSAFVFDYKYSGAQSTKSKVGDENLLQAPLYLLAAERAFDLKPAGMYYIGLKGSVVYAPWHGDSDGSFDLPADWRERAQEKTLRVLAEIRAGRIEAAPADRDKCRLCDYGDVCRIESRLAAVEEGAE